MNALNRIYSFIFMSFLSLGGASLFAAISPMGYDAEEALEKLEQIVVSEPGSLNCVDSDGMSPMAFIAMGRLDLAVALLDDPVVVESSEDASIEPILLSHPSSECHVWLSHKTDLFLADLYQAYLDTRPGNQKLCYDPRFYQRSAFVEAFEENPENYEDFISILVQAVDLLVDRGVDVNGEGRHESPLLLAAQQPGSATLVDTLLRHGARIDVSDSLGYNALHFAVLARNYDACKRLLEAGVDPLSASCFGYTPVQLASAHPVVSVKEEYSILTEEAVSQRLNHGKISLGHLKINEDRELAEPIRELLFEYQGSRVCYFIIEESPFIYYQSPADSASREAYVDSRRPDYRNPSAGSFGGEDTQQSYAEWAWEFVKDNSVGLTASAASLVVPSIAFLLHQYATVERWNPQVIVGAGAAALGEGARVGVRERGVVDALLEQMVADQPWMNGIQVSQAVQVDVWALLNERGVPVAAPAA